MGESFSYDEALDSAPPKLAAPKTFSYEEADKPETFSYDEAGNEPERPSITSQFGSAFKSSLIRENPKLIGSGIEAYGLAMGSETGQHIGQAMQKWGEGNDEEFHPTVGSFTDIRSPRDVADYFASMAGSGLGSSVPSVVTGGAGAALGSLAAPGVGTLVGGVTGAAMPSLPMNTGDLFDQLKQEGVKPETAAKWAVAGGLPITALDTASFGNIASPLTGGIKREISKSIAKRIAKGLAEGALTEGSTEGLQQIISESVAAGLTGNADVKDRAIRVVDNFFGGVAAGAPSGAVTHGLANPSETPVNPGAEPQPGSTPAPGVPAAASSGRPVAPGYDVRYDTPSQTFAVYGEDGRPIRGGFKAPEEAADFTHGLATPEPATPKPNVSAELPGNQAAQPATLAAASDQQVSQSTPEPARDIAAQIKAMLDPSTDRDAVFVAAGNESAVPDKVEGAEILRRPGIGTLITTDPEKAYNFLGKQDLNDADIQSILGYSQSKFDAVRGGAEPVVVQARTPEGIAAEQIAAPGDVDQARAAISRLAPDGSTVEETTPAEALARRQVAEAEELRRAFAEMADADEQFSVRDDPAAAPVFYSALTKAVEDSKQQKAHPSQWKGILKNLPGIKPDELAWSGVDQWLDQQQGLVTREQVADYLRQNEIQVREVVKGAEKSQGDIDQSARVLAANDGVRWGDLDGDERTDYLTAAGDQIDPQGEATKYGEYTTPGGSNYRELLLTLPSDTPTSDRDGAYYAETTRDYKSPHWEEPNVLAHIRFNDRVGPNGEKILHVEEVQSDWHQRGRMAGYVGDEESFRPVETRGGFVVIDNNGIQRGDLFEDFDRAEDFANNLNGDKTKSELVPNAPFKDSSQWGLLAMKPALRWAAEHGYDSVTWAPGEVHADRYDLSKKISRVALHDKVSRGIGKPDMEGPFTEGMVEAYDHDGKMVIGEHIRSPERLADLIGKEAAEKLLNAPAKAGRSAGVGVRQRELSGLDLKVGGEGMKGFYDKILPSTMDKYLKRWGVKVGKSDIDAGVKTSKSGASTIEVFDAATGKTVGFQDTEEGAQQLVEAGKRLGRIYDYEKPKRNTMAVHSIPITDAMRESVLQGQPQFNVRNEGKPLSDIANTVRGTIHESRTARIPVERGAVAIKQRLRHQLQRDLEQRQAYGNVRPLTEPEVAEIESFIDFIGDKFFSDVGLAILPGRNNIMGSYNTANKIVALYRAAIERGAAPSTMIHELWHTLERALSHQDKRELTREFFNAQASYLMQNPWAMPFRDDRGYLQNNLTGKAAEDWMQQFGDNPAAQQNTRVYWQDGKPSVRMLWTDKNYRFSNPSEYFAETMTDKYQDYAQSAQNPRAGGIMNWMRDLYQRMADGLNRLFGTMAPTDRIFRDFRDSKVEGLLAEIGPIADYGSLDSVQEQRTAKEVLGDAIKSLKRHKTAPALPNVTDLGSFANWENHPSTVASFHAEFAPVFETALSMFAERDRSVDTLTKLAGPYLASNGKDKAQVNKLLELGRLEGRTFQPDAQGQITAVNTFGDIADWKYGENLTLTPVQSKGYLAVRQTMDAALEAFRGQVLSDYGVDRQASVAELRQQAGGANSAADADRLNALADKIEEIENAARTGYVPFTRYGTMGITVTRANELGGKPTVVHFETIETDWGRNKTGKIVGRWKNRGKVADARQKLIEKYPAKDGYKVSEAREVFPKQSPDNLDLNALDQLANIAGADPTAYEAVRVAIDKAIQEGSFKKHFFQSKHTPGYSSDFERSIADYVMGISGYMARRNHREAFDRSLRSINADRKPVLYKYAKDYISYIQEPVEEWQGLRNFMFLYHLAGRFSSAFVNTIQPLAFSFPYLSQVTSRLNAANQLKRAYIDAGRMMSWHRGDPMPSFNPDKVPADLRDDFKKAWDDGVMVPVVSLDQMALSNGRTPKWLREKSLVIQKTVNHFAAIYSSAERLNRIVTWIAAHRVYSEQGTPEKVNKVLAKNARWFQQSMAATPASFANFVVDETQFRQGKVNRPRIGRGFGSAFFQMKFFNLQAIELMYKVARQNGPEARKAAALFAGVTMAFAGALGIPFMEDLKDGVELLWQKFGKKDLDIEQAVYDGFYEMSSPSWIPEAILRGPFRMVGVDISERAGMGKMVPRDFSDTSILVSFFLGRASKAIDFMAQKRYLEATGQTLPSALADPTTSYSWSQNGVVTGAGNTTLPPEALSGYDLAVKALGFTPTTVARGREIAWSQMRAEKSADEYKRNLRVRLAAEIANMIRSSQQDDKSGSDVASERMEQIIGEIFEYNITADPSETLDITSEAGHRAINERVKQNLQGRFAKKHRQAVQSRTEEIEQSRPQ